jgi:hypothetical protein
MFDVNGHKTQSRIATKLQTELRARKHGIRNYQKAFNPRKRRVQSMF